MKAQLPALLPGKTAAHLHAHFINGGLLPAYIRLFEAYSNAAALQTMAESDGFQVGRYSQEHY